MKAREKTAYEVLMEELFEYEIAWNEFKKFAEATHCAENFLFIEAADKFEYYSDEVVIQKFNELHRRFLADNDGRFLADDATTPVNISGQLRTELKELEKKLNPNDSKTADDVRNNLKNLRDIVKKIKNAISELILSDTLPKFTNNADPRFNYITYLKSAEYLKFLESPEYKKYQESPEYQAKHKKPLTKGHTSTKSSRLESIKLPPKEKRIETQPTTPPKSSTDILQSLTPPPSPSKIEPKKASIVTIGMQIVQNESRKSKEQEIEKPEKEEPIKQPRVLTKPLLRQAATVLLEKMIETAASDKKATAIQGGGMVLTDDQVVIRLMSTEQDSKRVEQVELQAGHPLIKPIGNLDKAIYEDRWSKQPGERRNPDALISAIREAYINFGSSKIEGIEIGSKPRISLKKFLGSLPEPTDKKTIPEPPDKQTTVFKKP